MPKSPLLAHADASIFSLTYPWKTMMTVSVYVTGYVTSSLLSPLWKSFCFFTLLRLYQEQTVSCKTRWLHGCHTAVDQRSIWWTFPLTLLWYQLYVFLRPQHHLVIFCLGLWTPQSGKGSRVCGYSLPFGMCWVGHTQRWCYRDPFSFGEWRLWVWVPSSPIFWAGTEVQSIAPWRCPGTVVHSIREQDKVVIISSFSPSLFHILSFLKRLP